MRNLQKGVVGLVVLVIVGLLVIGSGAYIYTNKKSELPVVDNTQTPPVTAQQNSGNTKPVSVTSPSVADIPNIIAEIRVDPETGGQGVVTNQTVLDQVRKDVKNGKLLWFKDPVEVSKKYGVRFGIGAGAQYVLDGEAVMGEGSGLWHSTVLATYNSKPYRISLMADPDQPLIWVFHSVTDIQQENKLRVTSLFTESTYETDGIGHREIVTKFGDGTTSFFLNVRKPIVTFSLNQPANPSTVTPDSVLVKIGNAVLSGATTKAVTEQQMAPHGGAPFPVYSIQVDLSRVTGLNNYVGQNIQIILTDKIKDNAGNPLQQCIVSNNKGQCVADSSGQKIKVYGAELKLYSL